MTKLCCAWIVLSLITLTITPRNFAAQANSTQPEFAFGVIADIQYCDCDNGATRYYRASLPKLTDCIQDLNTRELAFVVQLGDLIDRDFSSFDPVLPLYQQAQAPQYQVLGNHDFLVKPEEKTRVLEKLGLKKGYYDFSYHAWRFIVLDGNDLSFYAPSGTSPKYFEVQAIYQAATKKGLPNAQVWNGGISAEQMSWLQMILAKASEAGEKVMIFCHFPVFPDPNQHNLWNNQELMELLASYKGVVAYINGHNHAGNYAVKNGIHYLTLPAMVETPDQTAYAIVEVYADYLNIIGKGRVPSRILPIQ
jgi:manganese-dependent ADP-ribose/CDP-alcohol diphosphatase